MQTCPKCGLGSPDGALRCDCGCDFQSKTVKQSYVKDTSGIPLSKIGQSRRLARLWLSFCLILLAIDLAVHFTDKAMFCYAIVVPYLICCILYARAKGLSWWMGLFGILGLFGLTVLMLRHYKIQGLNYAR